MAGTGENKYQCSDQKSASEHDPEQRDGEAVASAAGGGQFARRTTRVEVGKDAKWEAIFSWTEGKGNKTTVPGPVRR